MLDYHLCLFPAATWRIAYCLCSWSSLPVLCAFALCSWWGGEADDVWRVGQAAGGEWMGTQLHSLAGRLTPRWLSGRTFSPVLFSLSQQPALCPQDVPVERELLPRSGELWVSQWWATICFLPRVATQEAKWPQVAFGFQTVLLSLLGLLPTTSYFFTLSLH